MTDKKRVTALAFTLVWLTAICFTAVGGLLLAFFHTIGSDFVKDDVIFEGTHYLWYASIGMTFLGGFVLMYRFSQTFEDNNVHQIKDEEWTQAQKELTGNGMSGSSF